MAGKGGGGKKRRKAKGCASRKRDGPLFCDPESQMYAYVMETLGNCHYRVKCDDGEVRLGVLRGSMRKRAWVRRSDMVIVTKRDFQEDKVDIVHKYFYEDVLQLVSHEQIPGELQTLYNNGEASSENKNDEYIVFAEEVDIAAI